MSDTGNPHIERWKRAYEAANGMPAPAVTYWGNGWWKVAGRAVKRQGRHFAEYAERLEAMAAHRAAEAPTPERKAP
jgi:hypothetical protein